MTFTLSLLATFAIFGVVGGFTFQPPSPSSFRRSAPFTSLSGVADDVARQTGYAAGKANTEFARRFGDRAGAKVKTVSESMTEFTAHLDQPINALYRNFVTDLVATTHLTVVDARWSYDAVWALGMDTVFAILLKNYPEKDIAEAICESVAHVVVNKTMESIRADAATITAWAEGKTVAEIDAAVNGEGGGPVADIAKDIKADEFWLYSRFFGVGLIKIMESANKEIDTDGMKSLIEGKLGKSPQKAMNDLDQWNGLRSKLGMMETLMKEIEIREKKKMADRLEEKAKAVIAKQDRDGDKEKAFDEALKKGAAAADTNANADIVAESDTDGEATEGETQTQNTDEEKKEEQDN